MELLLASLAKETQIVIPLRALLILSAGVAGVGGAWGHAKELTIQTKALTQPYLHIWRWPFRLMCWNSLICILLRHVRA